MYKKAKLLIICITQFFKYKLLYGQRMKMPFINSLKGKFSVELLQESRCEIGKFLMTAGPFYLKGIQGSKVIIGSKCFFNHNCSITCAERVEIGNGCNIANNVVIIDHDHNLEETGVVEGYSKAPIKIGDNVWCGANVTILKGVTIGNGAVIAAGAVVNRDIPAYEVWGGVPAKCIKRLYSEKV